MPIKPVSLVPKLQRIFAFLSSTPAGHNTLETAPFLHEVQFFKNRPIIIEVIEKVVRALPPAPRNSIKPKSFLRGILANL